MAEYNTVPLGQAGTGAAFTLGENRALPLFQQQIQSGIQQRDLEAQKLAKSWRDNALAASTGRLFAKELGELEQQHIQDGYLLRQQGIDPYTSADEKSIDYMKKRRRIENLRAYRGGIEDDFKKGIELLSKSTEGEYDSDIINERNRIVEQGSIVDLMDRGASLPALQKRFSLGDNLKGLKAPTIQRESVENGLIRTEEFVDEPKARNLVISAMMNKPEGQAQLAKITRGVPIQELEALPATLDEIKKRVREDYSNNDSKSYLAGIKILPGTPQYEEYMDSTAKVLYDAKRDLDSTLNRGISQISQGIKTIDKSKPTMTEGEKKRLAISEANLALSRERLRIEKDKAAKGETVKDTPELQRQVDIEEMINGVPGSGERIGAIMAGRGGYQGKLGIEDKGNTITFTIPKRVVTTESITTDQYDMEVTKPKTTVTPARKITIRKNNESDKIRFNEILNDITGEKISYRSFKTGNPSGNVSKTTVTKPKATSVTTTKFKGVPKGGF